MPELTANQRVVLDELRTGGRPLTAYQLLDRLRVHGFQAPPTVYRALERLLALGLVDGAASGAGPTSAGTEALRSTRQAVRRALPGNAVRAVRRMRASS